MAISSKVERITPEVAQKILEESKDIRNRNVSDSHVAWLAAQMKSNKWMLNGEAIILDDEDQLIDGQHRLWAVINSGVTIESLVVRGADRKGFASIDTGAARTLGNVLGITGEKDSVALGSALSWVYRHDIGKMFSSSKTAGFTSAVGLALMRKYPELRDAVEYSGKNRNNEILKRVSRSVMIFLYHRFSAHSKEKAAEFFECLSDQRFDTSGTATRSLRDWLLRRDPGGGTNATLELLAIFVKAWTMFLDGRAPAKSYSWRRSGDTPEDFPKFPGEKDSAGKAMKIVRRKSKPKEE